MNILTGMMGVNWRSQGRWEVRRENWKNPESSEGSCDINVALGLRP